MLSTTIQVGDNIHARFYSGDRGQVAMQTFVVTEIVGSIYKGGAIDVDIEQGWEVEILWKGLENLGLPETLSEITARASNGSVYHLIGKKDAWMTTKGEKIEALAILSWVEGHV